MAKIKICGITTQDEITYANALQPDYIGFVLAPSKRHVSPETAANLKASLSPDIQAVGVFVNADIKTIQELCSSNVIDSVQIHGDEDAAYLQMLKKAIPNTIIRAVRVQNEADIKNALSIAADYILFDTYQAGSYGGTGAAFNWKLLAGYPTPFILAGGLCAENLQNALSACSPWCVDVSGGAETAGKKDMQKMQQIIQIARSVD